MKPSAPETYADPLLENNAVKLGAWLQHDDAHFKVWAEDAKQVEVVLVNSRGKEQSSYPLARDEQGYFSGIIPAAATKSGGALRYMYRLDGDAMRPDPASRYQPEGVHGPSRLVTSAFDWTDHAWKGVPLEDAVIYELHVGTFTPEGTFEAIIGKLPYLKTLGVTVIELMPVADFPGDRNWGYDGVDLYAPSRAYGGPEQLKHLVNAAHEQGLAIMLDVVYNHLGPSGNYLQNFSSTYFTSGSKTPWGDSLNFENPHVRDFFIGNALHWLHEYHIDGLRLDAIHAILDPTDEHILAEMARRVRQSINSARSVLLIAEDERNERRLITSQSQGGTGLDAVWADDFHHEVRVALTHESEGYYADYSGTANDIAETLAHNWFYRGQRSEFSGKQRGSDASHLDPARFVNCIQNHDQVGNRALGDRLNASADRDAYLAASALLLMSPATPLLFQGQEWAASTPFLFFTDHEENLGKMVTQGRRAEFAHFKRFHAEEVPDPQAAATFQASKLRWAEIRSDGHAAALELYRELLAARKSLLPPSMRRRANITSLPFGDSALGIRYSASSKAERDVLIIVNLRGAFEIDLSGNQLTMPAQAHMWRVILGTSEWETIGTGQPLGSGQLLLPSVIMTERPSALILQSHP